MKKIKVKISYAKTEPVDGATKFHFKEGSPVYYIEGIGKVSEKKFNEYIASKKK